MGYHPSLKQRAFVCAIAQRFFEAALEKLGQQSGIVARTKSSNARTMTFDWRAIQRVQKDEILAEAGVIGGGKSNVYFVLSREFVAACGDTLPVGSANALDGDQAPMMRLIASLCEAATEVVQGMGFASMQFSTDPQDIMVCVGTTVEPIGYRNQSMICIQIELECDGAPDRAWCLMPEFLSRLLSLAA